VLHDPFRIGKVAEKFYNRLHNNSC